jgi:hypothetical protein
MLSTQISTSLYWLAYSVVLMRDCLRFRSFKHQPRVKALLLFLSFGERVMGGAQQARGGCMAASPKVAAGQPQGAEDELHALLVSLRHPPLVLCLSSPCFAFSPLLGLPLSLLLLRLSLPSNSFTIPSFPLLHEQMQMSHHPHQDNMHVMLLRGGMAGCKDFDSGHSGP